MWKVVMTKTLMQPSSNDHLLEAPRNHVIPSVMCLKANSVDIE